jgi:hypothetical protein
MSVLSHLESTASKLLLSAQENSSISTSLDTLNTRLSNYFQSGTVREKFAFGSWTRSINLPRKADLKSDVDLAVVFYGSDELSPQTLLNRLKNFVESKYSTSIVRQSYPAIVLSLNNIHFELVPAVREGNQSSSTLYIPSVASDFNRWQPTYIHTARKNLEDHNKANYNLTRPLLRLLKYWNCQSDVRPYSSFELEEYILSRSYYGCVNVKDILYTAIDFLPINAGKAENKKAKISRLKNIIAEVRELEKELMPYSAEAKIKDIIPEVK